jgi:hypothetical protein
MNALARIDFSDGHPRLLLVDFGDNDVNKYKDSAGIIRLKVSNRKIVIDNTSEEVIIKASVK